MKKYFMFFTLIACWTTAVAQGSLSNSFDSGWRFKLGNEMGAETPGYNDKQWRQVNLPHDWSIEDLPSQQPGKIVGPFDQSSIGGLATGFTVGGTGWYRKIFKLANKESGKKITLYFDGVYTNAEVWINGHHLGGHPHGYTAFYFELTPYLNAPGKENVIAVKVDNEGKNSRWYSGSGIYRHVWLDITDKTSFAPWGIVITTPKVTNMTAEFSLNASIQNSRTEKTTFNLKTVVYSPSGKIAGTLQRAITLEAGESSQENLTLEIASPQLWQLSDPSLYKAVTELKKGSEILDRNTTEFGIRTISFSAEKGFLLNGQHVALKGGCIHHDNGPLGAKAIDRAEFRKVELLKANGFNAIRTSHNPPSKHFLEACDRLGMLVIDESFDMWEVAKNPQDYHQYFKEWWKKDIDAMVSSARNHPSVILYSIGNEINERVDSSGLRITGELAAEVKRLDPTRGVTLAVNQFWDHPGYQWDSTAKTFELVDVAGYNYAMEFYESDHAKYPKRVMLGTESFPKKAFENWDLIEKNPYIIGDFVWTAMDYLGEASLGSFRTDKSKKALGWPWINANCGDLDLIGIKKPQSYYRDVVWRTRPIAMAVHQPLPEDARERVSFWGWPGEQQSWTWNTTEGQIVDVRVFSRSPLVRLYLNNKMVGEAKPADASIVATFKVPYQKGTLKAVNVVQGKETDSVILTTAGTPKKIRLVADRTKIKADANDLSYITLEILDQNGVLIPEAIVPVRFSIQGMGELAGAGNANPEEPHSYSSLDQNTFQGRCLLIVRPKAEKGKITVKAESSGLEQAEIVIQTGLAK